MKENKVVEAGIGYTIGNILIRGIGFISIPIFTRIMSTADYGLYNTYAAYEAIFYLVISLALNSSVKSAKLRYEEKFSEYVSSIATLVLCNTIIWLIIVNLVYPIIHGQIWEYSRFVLNILVFHSCGSSLILIYNAVVSVRYQYKSYLTMAMINSIGGVVSSVLLILFVFTTESYLGRILGCVLAISAVSILIIITFYKEAKPNLKKSYVTFALKYSLPVVPHGISQVLLSQFDRIMITNLVGHIEAGIYSFTGNVSSIMKVIVNSITTAWGPWFFEEYNKGNIENIRKNTRYCIYGFSVFTCGVMLCMPEVLKLMAPHEYWDGIRLVVPMALDVFCTFLYSVYVEVEYYHKKTHYLMVATIGAAIINVVLNFIFIGLYGYVMAAYTTLFSYICYFIFHYIVSVKIAGMDVFKLLSNIPSIILCVVIAIISAVFANFWIVRWCVALLLVIVSAIMFKPVIASLLGHRR